MTDMTPETPTRGRRNGRMALGAGLIAAGAIAGGVLAGTMSASAETTPTPSTTSSSGTASGTEDSGEAAAGQSGARGQGGDQHGSASVRDDEKVLTGTDAEKAKAAALKAVPGGTVYRVETDAGDAEYEAHMTKADGTEVTVKLDANFAVIEVQDGMGTGDPASAGGKQGQAPAGQAPSGQAPDVQAPDVQAPSGTAPSASSSSSAAA